jgi:hypothetical protein
VVPHGHALRWQRAAFGAATGGASRVPGKTNARSISPMPLKHLLPKMQNLQRRQKTTNRMMCRCGSSMCLGAATGGGRPAGSKDPVWYSSESQNAPKQLLHFSAGCPVPADDKQVIHCRWIRAAHWRVWCVPSHHFLELRASVRVVPWLWFRLCPVAVFYACSCLDFPSPCVHNSSCLIHSSILCDYVSEDYRTGSMCAGVAIFCTDRHECCAACVRVRPAFAGDGKYFVRVKEGAASFTGINTFDGTDSCRVAPLFSPASISPSFWCRSRRVLPCQGRACVLQVRMSTSSMAKTWTRVPTLSALSPVRAFSADLSRACRRFKCYIMALQLMHSWSCQVKPALSRGAWQRLPASVAFPCHDHC